MNHQEYKIDNLPPVVYIAVFNAHQYSVVESMLSYTHKFYGTQLGFDGSKTMNFVVNSEDNTFWDTAQLNNPHNPSIPIRDFIDSNTESLPADYDESSTFPPENEIVEPDMCYFIGVDKDGVKLAEICLNKTKPTYKLSLTSAYLIVRGDLVEVCNKHNSKVKVYPREKCIIK